VDHKTRCDIESEANHGAWKHANSRFKSREMLDFLETRMFVSGRGFSAGPGSLPTKDSSRDPESLTQQRIMQQ
jgi:hypothetical protein